MNAARTLHVWINQHRVGELRDENDAWAWRYHEAWLHQPQCFALSPHLPLAAEWQHDGSSQRSVQWYFDNLLPEENQRHLLAEDAQVDAADAFALLAHYGKESAGSLVLLPANTTPSKHQQTQPLSHHALDKRIRMMPQTPLTHDAPKHMSLAGAQHKLAVIWQDEQFFEPTGNTPSTHILKPDHPSKAYPHSVINEWFCMQLAKRMGLNVPQTHRCYVPSPVYVIQRFDRHLHHATWQRQHCLDACQLMGLSRQFKYQQGSIDTLAALANACRGSAIVKTQLFTWLVFNALIGNGDAHLKNLTFFIDRVGIRLAPHYDLLSTAVYQSTAFDQSQWPQTPLAWPIGTIRHFSDISRQTLLHAGARLGIQTATAQRLLERQCSRIIKQAEALYADMLEDNQTRQNQQPSLGITFDAETRCVRAIIHTIIKDMVMRVAA